MKDYTVNEAREIISKYFDKIIVERKKDDGVNCYGIGNCRKCIFWNGETGCNNNKFDNEYLAKTEEFINQVDWSNVAVDTKILVRYGANEKWEKRYFAKYENGKVYAWRNGRTSWNSEGICYYWECAKLYNKEEENE